MSLGSSAKSTSASLLKGRDVVYLEPITKVAGELVPPFFRTKERAPGGAGQKWIVSNDPNIDFVEGLLVHGRIELRDPHPSSGLSGQIPFVHLYLLDAAKDSNIAYILETKMTTLGRDLVNSILNFTEFEKPLRIRLYNYNKGGKSWAGVTIETDLAADKPTAIKWKFDKSKYLKAKAVEVGNRTEYDWSEVDNFLLSEFEAYTHLLSSQTADPTSTEAAGGEGGEAPRTATEDSTPTGTAATAPSSPKAIIKAFNPDVPSSRSDLIEYGTKAAVFGTREEVAAFVDRFIAQPENEPDLALRKRIFWKLLNTNLPEAMDETTEPLDPLRVIVFLAHGPLYNSQPPAEAVHVVADTFKRFMQERGQGRSTHDGLKLFIKSQNALAAKT